MASSQSSKLDRFVDTFAAYPWWVSLGFGGFMIVVLKLAAYSVAVGHPSFRPLAATMGSMWWAPALVFSGLAILSKLLEKRHAAALKRLASLEKLRAVPWRQFESLVGAYYRSEGYSVFENGVAGPDGGIDLVLVKNGQRTLVQCKKYQDRNVTVKHVRELLGVMHDEGAAKGILVTTTEFTADAMALGLRHAILELVPGPRLAQLVQERFGDNLEAPPEEAPTSKEAPADTAPHCPRCNEVMVQKKARRGVHQGKQFWGCPRWPGCKGNRSIPELMAEPTSR